MLVIEPKLLRDAKAGNYKAGVYGKVRGFLQASLQPVLTVLGYNILVLDISFYQDTADFDVMKANSISGVILRAGQNSWEDSRVKVFLRDAKAAGMPIGTYWFYDSRKSPQEQAELWKTIIGDYETVLGCWADYEENYGGQYAGWNNLYNFLEACKTKMPTRKFGIYTGYYYWLEHSPLTTASLNYFAQYPLWLAWYTEDMSTVKIPKPWTKMLFWQKSSSGDGTKYGVGSKEVDMNLFIGTKEEFELMAGTTVPDDPEEPEGDGKMYEVWSDNYNMSLRSGPSINEPKVGNSVPLGTKMIVDGFSVPSSGGIAGDEWAHVIEVNGVSKNLWVAVIHNGAVYCRKKEIVQAGEFPSVIYIATTEDMSDKVKYVKEA